MPCALTKICLFIAFIPPPHKDFNSVSLQLSFIFSNIPRAQSIVGTRESCPKCMERKKKSWWNVLRVAERTAMESDPCVCDLEEVLEQGNWSKGDLRGCRELEDSFGSV